MRKNKGMVTAFQENELRTFDKFQRMPCVPLQEIDGLLEKGERLGLNGIKSHKIGT